MRRILRNSAITVAVLLFLYWLISLYETALRDPRYFDGWLLCLGMVLQLLFHIRKKLPMLPLGRATNWMKAHIYMGYGVIAIFGFHTSFSFPDGAIEWALWINFIFVAFSGVLGAYLAWSVPAKLERRTEGIIFERIPAFRSQLAREVEDLAISSVNRSGSLTISDLYVNRLHDFFRRPQNLLSHLRNSRRPLKRICDEIDSLERYLDKSGEETLHAIKDLVVKKDDLDFQYAHNGFWQAWLFVHIPATHALIVLTIVHIGIVYAFSSGVP